MRLRNIVVLVVGLVTGSLVSAMTSQTPVRPPRPAGGQYHFAVWTTDNGLPQNSVGDIFQSRDGFLWFTTSDGLVRYDGVRFTVFNAGNRKDLKSSRLTSLFEGGDGSLWITTEDRK